MKLARRKLGGVSFLEGGSGPAFVLLHGIPGAATLWARVACRLTGRFHVIAPDLLGFGASDPPANDYYMKDQASAVAQLLRNLRINDAHLAGHDFGGPVAITLNRLFPEIRLQGLVLSATNVFTDPPVPVLMRTAAVPWLGDLVFRAIAGSRLGMRVMYRRAVGRKKSFSRESFDGMLSPSSIGYTRRIFQRSLSDLSGNYRDVQDHLKHIIAPTLVLWGASDPFFSVRMGERTAAAIPRATLRVLPEVGHFVPEEAHEEVAQSILEHFAG